MIREGVMISGRYEIMGRIGTGGMADVYKAIDRKLNRYVAIKVLKREFREDETFVKKFRTEAQSAAGLSHPNIVNVYDVGEDRGLYYIVMELVEGITLKDYIQKKGRLTAKEVTSIAVQVCSAIEMAHSHNIVHRDIKPQNIIISKDGKVKVTDFGIAKATSSNTISTNVMGSVHYTSPEQARGGFSDAKSDIYSLGITMYEMITGELPFDGDSTVSIALKHLQEDIVEPSEIVPEMPYSLEQIILKCTQKSPDRRYGDVTLLAKDLRRSLAEPDGEFVVIAPLTSAADTRMITPEELSRIQKAAAYEDEEEYDDEYSYDDDDDYEERRRRRKEAAGKKEIDPKMAKIMKILTIVVTVIFIFILIFVIGKAAGIFSVGPNDSQTETENERIEAPYLVGMTEEEAEEACEKVGLRLKVAARKESKTQEKGHIDSQRTQAGAKMPEGAFVQVVVSTGKLVEVPKLEGKNYVDARDALIDLGFDKKNIKMEEEPHDEIEEDEVTRTDPEEGSWITKESEITIYVSSGIEMIKVPDLLNKTKEDAEKTLTDLGLVGSVTEEYSSKQAGTVLSQGTDAGDEVAKGSTVEYVVSKGEEPKEMVKIPTGLKGKSFNSVKATLQNKGFVVEATYQTDNTYADGYVIHVDGEGVEAERGSTVVVVVSTGPEKPVTEPTPDGGNTDQNAGEP